MNEALDVNKAKEIEGSCLCGEVSFTVKAQFKAFYQCHCKQCQQLTGSAFASNIFTAIDNIEWQTGLSNVSHYEHPSRAFSKAFCCQCGSPVPFINKHKTSLVIPAGSLLGDPGVVPQANIFTPESVCWLEAGMQAKQYTHFPKDH